ncbi:MAG: MGH1-like glycoside hydrolase domain-containing protein, partial [bacterium]
LIRSCFDLAALAEELEMDDVAQRNYAWARRGLDALENLWSDPHRQYLCQDRTTGQLIESTSIGGLLAVFAPIRHIRAQAIAQRIEQISAECRFSIPSHDPADVRFDAKRYWRGPVWLIINYMINDGLEAADLEESSTKIVDDSLELIGSSGFAEYYDPKTGEACGGGRFTWTAAMVLEFLQDQ